MGMNIKNEEAHRLAQALAELTGESLTAAVIAALQERLQRIKTERTLTLSQRLTKIGKNCATHMKEPFRSMPHGDLLYDEHGLPR